MNYLLDTHVFIWFFNGDNTLPGKWVKLIEDGDNMCYLSVASLWEMAIKISLNKLSIEGHFDDIQDFMVKNEVELLPIGFDHLSELKKLPFHHRDPFDRLIIAQAIAVNFTVLTLDQHFQAYPVLIEPTSNGH